MRNAEVRDAYSACTQNVQFFGDDPDAVVVVQQECLIDSLATCPTRHAAPRAHLQSQLASSFWAC